ncbi:MAG: protein kinase [Polyangiaceae bacterium]|nr:protein kinase [Polyangiaceae bacterium]
MLEDDSLLAACQARIGQEIASKWRLDALIGVGGMAVVYLVSQRNGSIAALKLLLPELAAIPDVRARFEREAKIAASVDHPGAVKVIGLETTKDGTPFLVMELLTGMTVEARAQKMGGKLPLPEVLDIGAQTLDVLAAAHKKGVIHRDIKPANLFLPLKGPLKVLDFGIAKVRESNEARATLQKTKTGMAMGTPAFMAPEQALGRWQNVDHRTDLWATAATMYTLLTGAFVHEGTSLNEMMVSAATRPVPSLARIAPKTPIEVVTMIDKALSFDAKNRYGSAAEMRDTLLAFKAKLGRHTAGVADTVPIQPVLIANTSSDREHAREATIRMLTPSTAPGIPAHGREVVPPAGLAETTPLRRAHAGTPPPNVSPKPSAPPPGNVQAKPSVPPPGDSLPPPGESSPPEAPRDPNRRAATDADVAHVDAGQMSAERKTALKDVFLLVDRTLHGNLQYGRDHVESKRRFSKAFARVAEALRDGDDALVWNVTPYSFQAGDVALWEPEAPLDLVPYRLFSSGVRTMGFLPGLRRAELDEFLRLWMLDPTKEISPEDDLVTLLWDASFEHIAFEAIDAFAEGDQKARADFEREVTSVLDECRAEYAADLAHAHEAARTSKKPVEEGGPDRLIELLLAGDRPLDVEGAARAQATKLGGTAKSALADVVRIDPATLEVLSAQMDVQQDVVSQRFVKIAADSFVDAERRGRSRPVSIALRSAVDGLAESQAGSAVELVCGLCAAIELDNPTETERLRELLTAGILSGETMRNIVTAAVAEGVEKEAFQHGLETLLRFVDGSHAPLILGLLSDPRAEPMVRVLLGYLSRRGQGHEAAMGALFASADVEVGIGLVNVLAELGTNAAREAIMSAAKSPHALVRIEALGHLEGHSSERLRLELRALLEDKDGSVRVATLRRMAQHRVRAAGPYLVLRVKRGDFDNLPVEERRQALATVVALTAARAEAVCIELLLDRKLFAPAAHEETREMAAEILGDIARTQDAEKALQEAVEKRFKSSDRVRNAASKALAKLSARIASGVTAQSSMPPPKNTAKKGAS